jgi:hypothetical protein
MNSTQTAPKEKARTYFIEWRDGTTTEHRGLLADMCALIGTRDAIVFAIRSNALYRVQTHLDGRVV